MKIAFAVSAFQLGGVETFLLRLGQFLIDKGHEVTLFATEASGAWFHKWSNDVSRGEFIAPHPLRSLRSHSKKIGRRLALGKFDVVVTNHARFAQSALGCLPDACVAIPIVHNDAPTVYRIACSNPECWNVAVAVGAKVESETRKHLPHKPVVQIPYGVPTPAPRANADAFEGNGTLRMAYVGRLEHKQKGVLLLPEILTGLRERKIDCHLTIAGTGRDEQKLRELIHHSGAGDRVEFVGAISPEEVQPLLGRSHVLLLPSYYEGLPIILLEAMAAGCVPVASRLPGITDFAVRHGQSGMLIEPGNGTGFAEAIAWLGTSPDRWRTLSAAGAAEARSRFSVETMGQAYLQLFERAVAGEYPLAKSRRQSPVLCPQLFARRDVFPHAINCLLDRWRGQLKSASSGSFSL
jgi:glycosyltransferase involved in cell wall biosynthesis